MGPLETLSKMFKGMIVIFAAVLTAATAKEAKAFSLFNVVTFQNDACTSTSITTGSGARIGQCFTTEVLTAQGGAAFINNPICDCTLPFRVGVFTDGPLTAAGAANEDVGVAGFLPSRGVCLDYKQI